MITEEKVKELLAESEHALNASMRDASKAKSQDARIIASEQCAVLQAEVNVLKQVLEIPIEETW